MKTKNIFKNHEDKKNIFKNHEDTQSGLWEIYLIDINIKVYFRNIKSNIHLTYINIKIYFCSTLIQKYI